MSFKQLYFISFIEGGVVMVTEITGAKILTPFFGASLYSWASTLSITLLALMSGYYTGGYATTKPKYASADKIVWVFLISGLSVFMMPSLSYFIMQKTISFSFFSGLIISQLFFLFLPIFLMGMVSPMIIFQITKKAEQSGRSAGNIYAISTFGGILFTLVFGFFIIPNYGISSPVRFLGLIVSIIGLTILLKEKTITKKTSLIVLLTLTAFIAFNQNKQRTFPPKSNMQMVEYSEGILGELKVIDELTKSPDKKPVMLRKLKTNNVQQNFVFASLTSQSLLYYVNFTKQLIDFLPAKNSALLIGLGAGSLYTILKNKNIPTQTVEIDKRIYDIGVKYFDMPENKNNVITDGRYFINTINNKYDLIILDVIIGENVPAQLITIESFKKLYNLLNPNGTLIIEHGGINGFSNNSFIPSIYKTLQGAGFQTFIFNPLLSNTHGDIMFIATKNKFKIQNITIPNDVLIKGGQLTNFQLPIAIFNYKDAQVFTDDKNNIDILLKSHYFEVRKSIRKELAKIDAL